MTSKLTRSIDGNIVRWQYERLCILAALGELEMPLSDVRDVYDTNEWEVAPVKSEPILMRDFLASFHFRPPVDLTVDKSHHNNGASIISYSLDCERSKALIYELIQKSDFQARRPDPVFISDIETGHWPAIETYKRVIVLARTLNIPIDKNFGAIHYMNFLARYKRVPPQEQIRRTNERFDIELPRT